MAPPRARSSIHSAFSASSQPYSLSNTRESYRDLLIFEERLKQNSARLASQRRKYEAFLLSLVLSILFLAYRVFLVPSPYTLVHFFNSGLLLIGIVTLILFFATGVYSEKIAYAYKFVPQANRALRYFNIYLNTKQAPRKWSLNPIRLFRSTTPPSESPVSPLSRTPSITRSPSPRSKSFTARPTVPLAPIPPSNNPRGELIFSSKVGQGWREGYERYRGEWEKRRKPSRQEMGWWSWFTGGDSRKAMASKEQRAGLQAKKETGSASTSTDEKSMPMTKETSSASQRGRDIRARPLIRSHSNSSASSIASSSYSVSPPASRQPSPLRNPLLDDVSRGSSPSSSRRSTPELIAEEDEEYFERKDRGAMSSESSLASMGRRMASDESGEAVSPEAEEAGWTTQKGKGTRIR